MQPRAQSLSHPLLATSLAVVLAGCAAASPSFSSPTERPALSPGPTSGLATPTATLSEAPPTHTPLPSMPADLPMRVEFVKDAIRVLVHLDENPLEAGKPVWASVEIANVGSEDVIWSHDGCALPAGLSGQMPSSWRAGITQTGNAAKFKTQALDDRLGNGQLLLSFTPEPFVGMGHVACADIGIDEHLAPGETRHLRLRWSGFVYGDKGLPGPGPLTLQVQAIYFRPKSHRTYTELKADIPSWMTAGTAGVRLDPPEVVDAALDDEPFRTLIDGLDFLHGGFASYLWLEPAAERWHVGVIVFCEDCPGHGTVHGIDIDPQTGQVIERVEKPWDGIEH